MALHGKGAHSVTGGGGGGPVSPLNYEDQPYAAKFKYGEEEFAVGFDPGPSPDDTKIMKAATQAVARKVTELKLGPGKLKFDVYKDGGAKNKFDKGDTAIKNPFGGSNGIWNISLNAKKDELYLASMQFSQEEKVKDDKTKPDPKKAKLVIEKFHYVEKNVSEELSPSEAAKVLDQVQKLHPDDLVKVRQQNPFITYGPGKSMQFTAIEHLAAMKESDDPTSPDFNNPLTDPSSSIATRAAYRDRVMYKVDELIDQLLSAIASGNIDAIVEMFNLLQLQTGMRSTELAAVVGEALNKISKDSKAINDKLVEALKDGTKNSSKINDLRFQLEQTGILRQTYGDILREGMGRQEAMTTLGSSIRDKMERIVQSGSVWR